MPASCHPGCTLRTIPGWNAPGEWPAVWVLVLIAAAAPGRQGPARPESADCAGHSPSSLRSRGFDSPPVLDLAVQPKLLKRTFSNEGPLGNPPEHTVIGLL